MQKKFQVYCSTCSEETAFEIKREKENNPLYREELFPTPHHHEELSHIVIEEIIKSLENNSI